MLNGRCCCLDLLNKELLGSHLDQQQLTMPGVHLLGRVVEEDPEDDHRCAQAGEEGDLVAKEDDGGPNEESALAGVGHAVGDRADEVHEIVGGDGLAVEEESVQEQVEEHRQVRAQHLRHFSNVNIRTNGNVYTGTIPY